MQLLLIDNRVNDVKTVTDSLLENVDFVIVDFNNDTHDTLISKISVKTYDSVGIFQENYETNSYQYISSFTNSVLTNVSSEDPNLNTWSQFKSLLTYFKNTLQINTLDLMGCSIYSNLDWNYVIEHLGNQLQISINSSSDKTGSAIFGGNWILESSNTNLIGKYFSNNIINYQFVLGTINNSTVVITRDYKLYSCGEHPGTGIFSDVYQTLYNNFVAPLISSVVVKYFASVDNNSSFLLHADGSVSGTGLNTSGQLGIGPNKNYVSTFTNIYNPSINSNIKCIDLDCGVGHTILLLSDGSIWGTGLNTSGQLGTGNNTSINTFTKVYNPATNSNIKCTSLACGDNHTLYLLADGTVWGTGLNSTAQLGTGNTTSRNTFIKTWPVGNESIACVKLRTARGSAAHSHIIGSDGTTRGVGSNSAHQIYGGARPNQLTWYIPFFPYLFYNATTTIDVVCTGGTGANAFTAYILDNGVWIKTYNLEYGTYQLHYSGSVKPTELSVGYQSDTHVYLLNDGTVMGNGNNGNGQLGTNNFNYQANPISIYDPASNSNIKCVSISTSGAHVVLVLEDGSVRAAGINSSGQLGDGTILTGTIRRTFRTLYIPSANSGLKCIKAYAFPTVTILLMANGTLRTTGSNSIGQLGIYNGINAKLSYTYINNIEYISIGAASNNGGFSVILYKDGSVWGKGRNDGGQFAGGYNLGDIYYFKKVYDPTTNSNRKCIKLATNDGYGSTTLLLDNGSVMFTGYNGDGQVALGNTSSVLTFQHSYNPANNSNIKCIDISCVNGFNYILLENGYVMGVGANSYGQLGLGDLIRRTTYTTIYTPSNGLTCRNVYAEDGVGFLILSDGSLWGTGRNNLGQLGLGNYTQQTSFIKIYDPTTNSNVECVSCISRKNTFILLSDGSVRAVGPNTNGEMGLGNTTNQTSFVTIYNPSTNLNVKCRVINLSQYHSQLLLTDGTVLVAGLNNFGQLGIDTNTNQLSFVKMLNSDGTIMTDVYRLADNYYAPFVIPESPTITSINGISQSLQNSTIKINFTQTPIDATITNYSYSSDGITYTPFSPAQYTSPLTVPVTNLTTNSSYTFSIKAINDAGTSTASIGVSATIYFPPEKPSITSIVAYNGIATVNFTQPTTSVAVTNYAYSYSINGGSFTEFTPCNPVKTTSPLTIAGLVNNKVVSVRIRGINDNNSVDKYSDNSNTMSNVYVYSYEPIFCFKDNTKILTNNGYFAINELRKGVLIKTFEHGFKPITVIGKTNIKHEANQVRIPDQLYTYKQSESNNLNEDLVITGRHAILVDDFVSDKEKQDVIKLTGIIQKTDNKIHLPACVDSNSTVYETPGQYTVYHLALESEDKNTNYGIYANGLLVEACCEKYLESQTTIEFIE
jgi:alpha-tubulin suppressor-like RCC1 family protein